MGRWLGRKEKQEKVGEKGCRFRPKKKKGVAGRWPRLCIIWGFELVFNF